MDSLLKLARSTLESFFENKEIEISKEIINDFCKKQACFVTLTKDGKLRGCIGSLFPRQELYKDVIDNSINAAFNDFRFSPLTKEELKKIKIEISILSIPKKINFSCPEDLLKKIDKNMGIILRLKNHSATFLPQVWGQIPEKICFLEELSKKAGLDKNAWKNPETEIEYYRVKKIKED